MKRKRNICSNLLGQDGVCLFFHLVLILRYARAIQNHHLAVNSSQLNGNEPCFINMFIVTVIFQMGHIYEIMTLYPEVHMYTFMVLGSFVNDQYVQQISQSSNQGSHEMEHKEHGARN